MRLSVAYTFEPGLIEALGEYPEVEEVFGKLDRDDIGGGRSTYTLRPTSGRSLERSVSEAHRHGIAFNYLLNAASLGGMEQTRGGQRRIRRLLDRLSELRVDCVTVASPLLLKLIKARYPHFAVRIGVFALVDSTAKLKQWEDMGADTVCLSAISCNRDFEKLRRLREAARCRLQLIVNASCLPGCSHEPTHMNLLSAASRRGERLGGYCLDYCILHCSMQRLSDPVNYIRSIWIRPEDLRIYESLGYDSFKVLERSCSRELLLKRVAAYASRSFEGNLWELVGPVAQVTARQGAGPLQRLRTAAMMFRPRQVKIGSLRAMQRYADAIIPGKYERGATPVYIDNTALEGFLPGLMKRGCSPTDCERCGYCESWARRVVEIDRDHREKTFEQGRQLQEGMDSGGIWW